jgi:hypothetical protein
MPLLAFERDLPDGRREPSLREGGLGALGPLAGAATARTTRCRVFRRPDQGVGGRVLFKQPA